MPRDLSLSSQFSDRNAKRLKALEDETAKLKKLLAEQMLDEPHSASFSQKW